MSTFTFTLRAARGLAFGLALTAVAVPSWAHHSTAPFDGTHGTTIRGVVTEYEWQNPHSHILLDVKDDNGKVEHWTIETESLIILRRLGWSKDLLKPGDTITTIGARAKDGRFLMRCKTLDLPDGRQLPCFPQ